MTTAQQVIDLARIPLNDADKARHTDADMLGYLNFGLRALKKTRADLFIGSLKTGHTTLVLADALPTPEEMDQAIADYLTARATLLDDPSEEMERTAAFLKLSGGML